MDEETLAVIVPSPLSGCFDYLQAFPVPQETTSTTLKAVIGSLLEHSVSTVTLPLIHPQL